MQKAAKRNLVLTTVSSFNVSGGTGQTIEQEGLYQHITFALIKGTYKKQLDDVGNELIAMADHAMALRQSDVVERISEILINGPLSREYHNIGQYYRALSVKGRVGIPAVNALLEGVASSTATPLRYRARALQAIGGNHFDSGKTTEGLHFFLEAGHTASPKHGCDLLTATLSPWMIAVIRSIKGDHRGALTDLQKLFPFVRLIAPDYPHYYYAYFNARAVELGELNRIEEAQNASRIALTSPFTHQHLEMQITASDIEQKARRASRSVVAINRKGIQLEVHTGEETSEKTSNQQAPLTMGNEPSDPGNKLLLFRRRAFKSNKEPLYSHLEATQSKLTLAQKRSRVIDIVHNLDEEALDRLLEFASELDDQPAQPRRPREINLEERGNLEMLISLWTTGDLNIDDHVAVLSALRDCDDNLRRKNIINLMISYMFRFTQERMEGEHFWRKRVEAQLAPETD
jgi:tetratricopeptide (TPR) repeat protein